MTAAENQPRRKRVLRRAIIGFGLLGIVLAAGLYLTSDSFQERVRRKLVVELERVTGARVEMKTFRWKLSTLEAEATDVTLHGLEKPDEIPYAHVDRLYARAKIISFFGREIGLRAVTIERPVIHIIVFPDGSTNQPIPKAKIESNQSAIDRLFELAVDHAEIREGMLLFNDKRIPFDFAGNEVSAQMTYAFLAHRYDGSIHVGKMDATYTNYLPLRSAADLEFSLARDGAEVKALHWSSAKSKVDASGRMTNFLDPKIDLSYNVALDLPEFSAISRTPEMRNGKLIVNGQGTYTVAEFSTAGRVVLQNAIWTEQGRDVPGLTASANFSAQRDRIAISNMNGTLLGGKISGDADVYHWSRAAEKTGAKTKATAGEPQRGSASVKFSGISIAELAASLSTVRLPLNRIQLAGSADGTIDAKWVGAPSNGDVSVLADIVSPAGPATRVLPVNGRVRFDYHGTSQTVQVGELSLATPNTRLNAAGTLGSDTARLNVMLDSSEFGELQPVLTAMHHPGQLPVAIRGRASFNGRVFGKLNTPSVVGHVELTDFDTTIEIPQSATTAAVPAPLPAAQKQLVQAVRATIVRWDKF